MTPYYCLLHFGSLSRYIEKLLKIFSLHVMAETLNRPLGASQTENNVPDEFLDHDFRIALSRSFRLYIAIVES